MFPTKNLNNVGLGDVKSITMSSDDALDLSIKILPQSTRAVHYVHPALYPVSIWTLLDVFGFQPETVFAMCKIKILPHSNWIVMKKNMGNQE